MTTHCRLHKNHERARAFILSRLAAIVVGLVHFCSVASAHGRIEIEKAALGNVSSRVALCKNITVRVALVRFVPSLRLELISRRTVTGENVDHAL